MDVGFWLVGRLSLVEWTLNFGCVDFGCVDVGFCLNLTSNRHQKHTSVQRQICVTTLDYDVKTICKYNQTTK